MNRPRSRAEAQNDAPDLRRDGELARTERHISARGARRTERRFGRGLAGGFCPFGRVIRSARPRFVSSVVLLDGDGLGLRASVLIQT
jgi:hypothetical protein